MSYFKGDIGAYGRDLVLNDPDARLDPVFYDFNIPAHSFDIELDSLMFEDNGGIDLVGLGRFSADLYQGTPPYLLMDVALEFGGLSISGSGGATSADLYICADGFLYTGYYRCRPDGTSNPEVNPDGEWYNYHDNLDGMSLVMDTGSTRIYNNFDYLGRGVEFEFLQVIPLPSAVWLMGSGLFFMLSFRKFAPI